MSACWHCQSTGVCTCAFCGADKIVDGNLTRIAGRCGFCAGREFIERHRAVLDQSDMADPNNWKRVAAADGNKGYRIFLPFEGLK